MMKNPLPYILFFCFSALFAQQTQQVSLNWQSVSPVKIGNYTYNIPHFDAAYMSFYTTGELVYSDGFATSGPVDPESLQISNIVYENITKADLGDINPALLPSGHKATLQALNGRGVWKGLLKLYPIVKEGSGYKRIKSFSYSYALASSAGRQVNTVNTVTAVSNSVLNTGSWYRFYVTKSGVYKLSKAFLSSLGFDTNVDPRTIKIYGNGGHMLPMLNGTYYPMDLTENAVRFVGEDDGKFDNADYILFYAEGVTGWNAESLTNNNLYADNSYYYVTAGSGTGKRIQANVQPTGTAALAVSSFDDYQFHELDKVNIAHLGRKWHGETFELENEQEFEFDITDIDASSPAKVTVSAAANAIVATSMSVAVNGSVVGTMNYVANSSSDRAAYDGYYSGSITPSGSTIKVKLTYNNNGVPSANAWLDYINVEAKRLLKGSGRQYGFRYNAAASQLGIIQYNFTSASGISEVWDVTDIYNVSSITNDAGSAFSFNASGGEVRQYVTVVPNDYYTPLRESKTRVTNQNLKGTILKNSQGQFQDVEYLIITPKFLNSNAEELANLHRNYSGMVVKVVNLEDIYEEFSSGKQDVGAIRNFIKYVYNNASSADKRVKYVNLFGEASFDYKKRISGNTNIVPTVHGIHMTQSGANAYLNYSTTETFVTDDFYGAMDDNEGPMVVGNSFYDYGLDIATGRMLVTTVADAADMVKKVKQYLDKTSYGRWRNEYVMLADDKDASYDTFADTIEEIATTISQYKSFINMRKVYLDSYVQQATSGGQRYPEAREQLIRYINTGALVVNYLGHGGIRGMASERVFTVADAQELKNDYKFSLFITATCDLTRFDNPYEESAGEYIYKNVTGGAIAMITTTRSIYISAAVALNENLSAYLYSYNGGVNTYTYPTMAEALRLTKFDSDNSQFVTCVSFIGDPALSLAIPKQKVILTKINDVPIAQSTDVLQSLAYVKLTGQVTSESGAVETGFNGEIEVTVFDKDVQRTTLVNDGQGSPIPFSTLGETIFRGNATVVNGEFSVGFVVPRDIKIPVGNARVSFYAEKLSALDDRTGYSTDIKVGGVNNNAVADNTPPTVKLYMNDENFVSGGITNDSPTLLAYLEDLHGINTSSGIGHDIIGILDGDETTQYVMNDYYEAAADDYTRGTVRYPLRNLSAGLHTLTFQAWDVYNNLVTAEIQFVVAGSDELKLDKVLNYPNPFVSYTEFWFNHNRPLEPLDVQVQIFTVTGKIVKTINSQVTTEGFLSREIKWDGRDDYGDKIGKGVYIYKLTVKSTSSNKKAEKYEKLVLL